MAPEKETYLGLQLPADGFQIRTTGTSIGAGEDLEFCEVLELPGTPSVTYYVQSVEVGNGKGSHHLILDAARPGGAAEPVVMAAPLGEPTPCLGSSAKFGDGFENVAVSQQPYVRLDLPAGVGRVLRGGQRVVVDYHYYNTTEDDVQARSAVNFHLVNEEDVQHVARVFAFNNSTIDTPPLSRKSFVGECHFKDDIVLAQLTRHTHQWGRNYVVWYAGGPNDGQEIFRTPDYEHGILHDFGAAPIAVKAGEGFRFQCDYENTEDRPLRFGLNATDEMCFLFGTWWGDNDTTPQPQDCTMTAIDTKGVARPPSEVAFPAPTEPQKNACGVVDDAAKRPLESSCEACYCDSCAVPIIDCAADPDCKAILDCAIETRCGFTTCLSACPDVFNEHSAGTGLIIPVGQCLMGACSQCTQ